MKNLLLFIFATLLFSACHLCDDQPTPDTDCDKTVVIDNDAYNNDQNTFFYLNSVSIDGDCLLVEYTASGCDGSTWVMDLYDSEDIAESLPPQRYLRLILTNTELCQAIFTKEVSFDISALQIEGLNSVLLNIDGMEESVLYSY